MREHEKKKKVKREGLSYRCAPGESGGDGYETLPGGLQDFGSPGEAEKGKRRVTPRIVTTATGQNEIENSGREPDFRWGERNS